ncbi:MAG: 50S ribosomal protein L25 [Candidatus Saccharimonadales bacterium]
MDEPLKLQERTVIGKRLGSLRHEGLIPAVIHNHGQPSIHVAVAEREMVRVYQEAGKHHPLNLSVGSQNFLALIKDVHINPLKRRMQHVVFQAVKRDEKVEAEVPIHIEGEIPAEKIGLVVLHQLDTVEVEALPKDLPNEFIVDGNKLAELHDKITVADLVVPSDVIILTDPEHPIASVVETKAQISEEIEEAVEAEEGAEGEAAEAEAAEGQAGKGEATETDTSSQQKAEK